MNSCSPSCRFSPPGLHSEVITEVKIGESSEFYCVRAHAEVMGKDYATALLGFEGWISMRSEPHDSEV